MPRTCPKCRNDLAFVPVRNGKLRCPECGTLLSLARADERLQTGPNASRRPASDGDPRRLRGAENESPMGIKPCTLPIVLILLGLGLGLVVVLAVGGFAALLYFRSATTPPTVASVPPEVPQNPAPAAPINPEPAKEPIQPAPPVQKAAGGNDLLPLEQLKAATVYIKGQMATMASRGSGLVVHAQGGTVYVATNHHVISPTVENAGPFPPFFGPQMPGMPNRPRSPFGPGFPFAPNHIMPPAGMIGLGALELTVVFYSGTAKEQSLPATVVGDDAINDLAILKATGVVDAPRPIEYRRTAKLRETMPVVAFGFPFGEKLDLQKRNPAVTVTKGAVSSLRMEDDQIGQVQLDLELNPGNSGGPVVDERGVLIGVAVAKMSDTRIGFAVPAAKLNRLLQGRIAAPARADSILVRGRIQVRVRAPASDPFGKLRSPKLLYGLASEVRMPRKMPNAWEPLSGAKTSEMTLQGAEAIATLMLTPPANGQLRIVAQVSYQDETGRTIFSPPRNLAIGVVNLQPAKSPPPSRIPKGEELTKLLTDLKSADEATRQRAASVLQQAPPRQRRTEVRRGLQTLLSAKNPATRKAGVLALTACDPKGAGPSLANLLGDDAQEVRLAVTNSLKDLRDPRVAEAVAARLPAEPVPVVEVLKAIGPAAEKAVLPYLADKYAGPTRFWAMHILEEIGTQASLPDLKAVPRPDSLHARRTIEAIRERTPLADGEWQQALDDLRSNNPRTRARGARRIAATPPSAERRADVVARLEGLLHDRFPDVCTAVVKGLGRWAGPAAIELLAKQMEEFYPPLHEAAIAVLAEMKSDKAAAAIAKRLPDIHDRAHVVRVLRAMDARMAEKAVLPLLSNRDQFVRKEAVKVLADVGGRDSIAPLEKLAKDDNVFYSDLARQAVESIKERSADAN